MVSTKENVQKSIDLPRDMPEVPEGEQARRDGVAVDDCPYQVGDLKRTSWMTGWYDERMRKRLGHIWDKYGKTYP